MAINLRDALKAQGHDVILWSPHPLPPARWWQALRRMRSKVDAFIETQGPFDVIDSPATLITKLMCRSGIVVARSIQPEILYLLNDLSLPAKWSVKNFARMPFNYLHTLFHLSLVFQGWRRARHIFCLGTLELEWMKKRFPWWRRKLVLYVNALSESDQTMLATARAQRREYCPERIRFLWIGRWVSHKGTDVLIDFIKRWAILRPQDIFTIAGCGPEAESDCPAELTGPGRVVIIPTFERKDLCSLLTSHDIGLFTSKVEGWGLALNEMLESGMPVFATQAGGALDLQPFFSALMPFPPSPKILCSLPEPRIASRYYEVFNWKHIAEIYAGEILAPLQEEGNLCLRAAQG
jgi:glycosyltransferase involved in cell wall biosynthesis